MFEETESMLNTAFSNYRYVNVVPQNKVCGYIKEEGKERILRLPRAFLLSNQRR